MVGAAVSAPRYTIRHEHNGFARERTGYVDLADAWAGVRRTIAEDGWAELVATDPATGEETVQFYGRKVSR